LQTLQTPARPFGRRNSDPPAGRLLSSAIAKYCHAEPGILEVSMMFAGPDRKIVIYSIGD
jgi:hypothetical protein